MSACNAARTIPPQPSSETFTETKSGARRHVWIAAARANGSGSIASEVESPTGIPVNRGTDRSDRGVTGARVHRLNPTVIARMQVDGERTSLANGDRVAGEFGWRLRYRLGSDGRARHSSKP